MHKYIETSDEKIQIKKDSKLLFITRFPSNTYAMRE